MSNSSMPPGRWTTGELVAHGMRVPLDELTATYISLQSPEHRARLEVGAAHIGRTATDEYLGTTRPRQGTGMAISYQDWPTVDHALRQYADQEDAPPQRILGYLNWPPDAHDEDIARARAQLDEFIDEHPHVPFAYFEGVEQRPLKMGRVRMLLNNLLLTQIAHDTLADVLMTNHDADMRLLVPRFQRSIQDPFDANTDFPFVTITPHLSHTRYPNLANMDTVIRWEDDARRMELARTYFESGLAWSARAYLGTGFDEELNLGEVLTMVDAMHQGNARRHPARLWVRDAGLQVLPRRQHYKMYQGLRDPRKFWTDVPGDLDAENDYRTLSEATVRAWPDISPAERDDMLRQSGAMTLYEVAMQMLIDSPDMSVPQAIDTSMAQLEELRQEIGGPPHMFTWAVTSVREYTYQQLQQRRRTGR